VINVQGRPTRCREAGSGRPPVPVHGAGGPLRLRSGFAYSQSPVPSSTLTSQTAAIMEYTVSAGVGYRDGPYSVDVAYQYDLPSEQRVGTSALLAGEYSQSRVRVDLHWVGVTASVRF
jgi:long-subunit fatty acid transport protein